MPLPRDGRLSSDNTTAAAGSSSMSQTGSLTPGLSRLCRPGVRELRCQPLAAEGELHLCFEDKRSGICLLRLISGALGRGGRSSHSLLPFGSYGGAELACCCVLLAPRLKQLGWQGSAC